MWEIVWLDGAMKDLKRLRDFIDQHNPEAAKRAAKTIVESTSKLTEFPLLGKVINELPDYRDLFIRFGAAGYVLRYRVEENIVYIVNIKHYREDQTAFKMAEAAKLQLELL
jgi:addiction module RelE/StbE family toxin